MIEIEWRGGECFLLKTKEASFAFNPNFSDSGAVQFATNSELLAPESDFRLSFFGEGEYEIAGTIVNGFSLGEDCIYNAHTSGIRLGVVGGGVSDLSEKELENLGVVDVLMFSPSSDVEASARLVRKIDPKIIVPLGEATEDFVATLKVTAVDAQRLKLKSASDIPPVMQVHRLSLVK